MCALPIYAGDQLADMPHGALALPAVKIQSYNLEIRNGKEFIGDRASGRAFLALLDKVQDGAGDKAEDALGDIRAAGLTKKEWDRSEERRGGKEGVSKCRLRWTPLH